LDDAVVDDRDAVAGVGVGVRVGLVRLTVGGPARVADADGGLGRARGLSCRQLVAEVLDASRGFGDLESASADDGEASRVVASVLQPVQSLDEDWRHIPLADITDDPAHVTVSLPRPRPMWLLAALLLFLAD